MSQKITIELQVDGGANAMDKLYVGEKYYDHDGRDEKNRKMHYIISAK